MRPKQTARKSTGGKAPRNSLVTNASCLHNQQRSFQQFDTVREESDGGEDIVERAPSPPASSRAASGSPHALQADQQFQQLAPSGVIERKRRHTARKSTGVGPPRGVIRTTLPQTYSQPLVTIEGYSESDAADEGEDSEGPPNPGDRSPQGMPLPMVTRWISSGTVIQAETTGSLVSRHPQPSDLEYTASSKRRAAGSLDLEQPAPKVARKVPATRRMTSTGVRVSVEKDLGEGVEEVTRHERYSGRSHAPLASSAPLAPSTPDEKPAAQAVSRLKGTPSSKAIGYTIMEIIRLQGFDGSFPAVHAMDRIFGKDAVMEAVTTYRTQSIGMTGLVVAYLEVHLADNSVLQALTEEARDYVEWQGENFEDVVADMGSLLSET